MSLDRTEMMMRLSRPEIVLMLIADPTFTLPHGRESRRRMAEAKADIAEIIMEQDGRFPARRVPPIGAERPDVTLRKTPLSEARVA